MGRRRRLHADECENLADVLDRIGNPNAIALTRVQNAADGDFGEWIRDPQKPPGYSANASPRAKYSPRGASVGKSRLGESVAPTESQN
jgi:hypothetical protein